MMSGRMNWARSGVLLTLSSLEIEQLALHDVDQLLRV